jgi:hypothetical protein
MFDNIINLNNYFNIKEHFAFDNTSINDSTKIKKSFETNNKIDRSMLVESVTKLVNNVSSDVVQKNSSSAASAVGASNTLWLSNVKCDDVVISGVRQNAQAVSQTSVKAAQTNQSKISNDISTSIDKTIEKAGSTDVAGLEAENTKKLNEFMKATPGYDPDKASKLAGECPGGGLFSLGNSCAVNSSYELDASVKNALDLDESFKINDTDDISTEIKTKLEQTNFASCSASASASNQIILQDITCDSMAAMNKAKQLDDPDKPLSKAKRGRLEISDIEQQAVGKLYMTCVFDQKNVSDIANKMVTKVAKKYNQIYDAIEKKGAEKGQAWVDEKMKLADLLSAAGAEKVIGAAANSDPSKTPVISESANAGNKTTDTPPIKETDKIDADKVAFKKLDPPKSDPSTPAAKPPAAKPPAATPAAATPAAADEGMSLETIIFIVIGFILLIGIGVGGYIYLKNKKIGNNMRNNNMNNNMRNNMRNNNYGNPYNFKYLKN